MAELKRTFKYYLNPTEFQRQKLNKALELCCWLNNYLLEQFRERDQKREEQPTEYQLINSLPRIKKQHLFLKGEISSMPLQEVAKEVYKRWQKYKELKRIDNKKGYPKFRPVHRYNSFVYPSPISKKGGCGYKIDNSFLIKKKENRKLEISFGGGNRWHPNSVKVKMIMERNIQGDIKTLTIKRKNNRYYACFACDGIEPRPLPKTNQNIGIDVNLEKKSYITLSNGVKYKHPQYYKKLEKKLIELQQSLNKKDKKSQNWKDAKLQLAKKWEKVVNQSKYYSYQVSNELVRGYDKLAVEKLQIKNMIKNPSLSKSIQQARWGILLKVISEAAEIATRRLVRVNPKNTSQNCSDCGEKAKEKLTLNQRRFECWNCDYKDDRDINSARNIYKMGFDQNLPSEIGGEVF